MPETKLWDSPLQDIVAAHRQVDHANIKQIGKQASTQVNPKDNFRRPLQARLRG
jgi:hypothetical protein